MLKAFAITDIGKKRKVNQDFVYVNETTLGNLPNLFIVADGMGGHNAGDYAAKIAVETIVEEIGKSFEKNPMRIFKNTIDVANREIRRAALQNPEYEGMGTTLVVATCMGKYLRVANVGDSRLYVIKNEIHQITRDHSLVEEMVRAGVLDREEAEQRQDKHIITRAVGASDFVEADYFTVELDENDMILMCSDGLTNMLDDEEIRRILNVAENVQEQAQELVKRANEKGGGDNISVIVIHPFE